LSCSNAYVLERIKKPESLLVILDLSISAAEFYLIRLKRNSQNRVLCGEFIFPKEAANPVKRALRAGFKLKLAL